MLTKISHQRHPSNNHKSEKTPLSFLFSPPPTIPYMFTSQTHLSSLPITHPYAKFDSVHISYPRLYSNRSTFAHTPTTKCSD